MVRTKDTYMVIVIPKSGGPNMAMTPDFKTLKGLMNFVKRKYIDQGFDNL